MFIFGVVKSTKQKKYLNQKKFETVIMVDFVLTVAERHLAQLKLY